jgi:hypothetical protein
MDFIGTLPGLLFNTIRPTLRTRRNATNIGIPTLFPRHSFGPGQSSNGKTFPANLADVKAAEEISENQALL